MICAEEVTPVAAGLLIFLDIALLAESLSNGRDAEVVVAVLQCARDGASVRAKAFVVKVLNGNVVKGLPAVEATTSLAAPV